MAVILGRDKEAKRLTKIVNSRKSQFVVVYGRRRVGKTFLVREYFDYKFDFQLTGLARGTTNQQLFNFHTTLENQGNQFYPTQPLNWLQAFQRLINYIKRIDEKKKKIIFLDEMPWMDTARSDFMMALEHFWNAWASARKDIVLIACGSATSWIIDKLIKDHGGLHNRVTERIHLQAFNLQETEQFLKSNYHVVDRYQIVNIFMITGGVPFYLEAFTSEKSADQNIEDLCFRKGALLNIEFHSLFASLFKKYENHIAIVEALSSKAKGMTRKELSEKATLPTGGSLTNILEELDQCGFITRYSPFGKKSRDALFRLSDFYTLFYFKFLKDNIDHHGSAWLNSVDSPAHRAWSGYAFEQVCLAHIPQIKKALGISGVVSRASSWISTKSKKGAQIDLLIDRRDQVISVCEIKYSIHPFRITKDYANKLRRKLGTFRQETKTRKSLFLTMITTFGIERNAHSTSLVQNEIVMDALFE